MFVALHTPKNGAKISVPSTMTCDQRGRHAIVRGVGDLDGKPRADDAAYGVNSPRGGRMSL